MVQTFSSVVHMSLVGSIAILAVLAARLLLHRAPRWISYALWLVVLFRLLCPWSPDSAISLIPDDLPVVSSAAAVSLDSTPIYVAEAMAEATADVLRGQPLDAIMADVGPDWMPTRLHIKDVLLLCAAWLWPLGMAVMALCNLAAYVRLKLRLMETISSENRICEVAGLRTPFVMGILRPKIYLPSGLSDRERPYILLHEQTHIRRGDHLWKLLAFLALTIHWFNPLVWLAFFCAVKDMETSCDEAVLKRMGPGIRADYSASLLRLATGRTTLLAFGEGDVKGRIKHILKRNRPALWLTILAAVTAVLLIVLLAVDPSSDYNIFGARYYVNKTLYHGNSTYSFTYAPENAPFFFIDESGHLYLRHMDEEWADQGRLHPVNLDISARNALFPNSNNHVQAVMDDVVKVYKTDDEALPMHCYLFVYKPIHWHNYHLYLAMGHSEEEMRWLFDLDTPDGADLDYLDFAISHTWTDAKSAHCFAVYEDNGLLLAAWSNGTKIGISKFRAHTASGRRTYEHTGGTANPTDGAVSCLAKTAFKRYAAFATQDPNRMSDTMRLDDQIIHLQPDTFPGIAVEAIPYTFKRYLADWFSHQTAETPVAESISQRVVDETEDDPADVMVHTDNAAAVYDLTENAPVSISGDRWSNHQFYTNSRQITVTGEQVFGEINVYLCDSETGYPVQQHTLSSGSTIRFQNLTSAQTYILKTDGGRNTILTLTD